MRDDEQFDPTLEALRQLPREIAPGQLLEERTVRALRERGLLAPTRWRVATSHWVWAAAAVVALALFSAGFVLGRSGPAGGAANSGGTSRAAGSAKPTRESGVAERQPSGRDVTVANGTRKPETAASERYVVWF